MRKVEYCNNCLTLVHVSHCLICINDLKPFSNISLPADTNEFKKKGWINEILEVRNRGKFYLDKSNDDDLPGIFKDLKDEYDGYNFRKKRK